MVLKAEDISNEAPEVESDLYELLGVKKDTSPDEIKSAYRRLALKHHPDKAAPDAREAAKEKFQELALANAVLSDKRRRERYDRTGDTTELLDGDDDFSWREYFQNQYKDIITTEAIEKIKQEYQHSDQERADLLEAYEEYEGDMDGVFEEIMCSSVLDDEERFRKIIDAAIKKGEVTAYEKYTKETKASRSRRQKAARSEAAEAMEMAEEMGIADKLFGGDTGKGKNGKKSSKKGADSEAALMSIIQQRQKDRSKNFLDDLEAKYAKQEAEKKASRKAKSGSRKRASPDDDDEDGENGDGPSEEAFQAMAERGKRAKTGRKGK